MTVPFPNSVSAWRMQARDAVPPRNPSNGDDEDEEDDDEDEDDQDREPAVIREPDKDD